MNERIFIIGDVEIGRRDRMDDFCNDVALIRFLDYLKFLARNEAICLVLNGDFFDFLKISYKNEYPRYITEEISLWKLNQVLRAHPLVFEAMKSFISYPNTELFFVIGNHDADLIWPALQKKIRNILGNQERVKFDFSFEANDFHVEHGNFADPFFSFDRLKPIIEYRGQRILNLPFGSHIATQYLIPIKKKFRREESLYPRNIVFEHHKDFKKAVKSLLYRHGWKIFMLDPLLHVGDPSYRIPYKALLRFVWMQGLRFSHDENFMEIKKLFQIYPAVKLFVLSHAHVLKDFSLNGYRILITDTWRNEYNILLKRKKDPTYAEILLKDGKMVSAELKVFIPLDERKHGKLKKRFVIEPKQVKINR